MNTPSIPGVNRFALMDAMISDVAAKPPGKITLEYIVNAVLAYIAAHQEPRACTCGAKYDQCPSCAADEAYEMGRKDAACDHADEWVEVDDATWDGLPDGVRLRQGWVRGDMVPSFRLFVHRDDLPDEPVDKRIEVVGQWLAEYIGENECGTADDWRNEAESLLEALNKIESER